MDDNCTLEFLCIILPTCSMYSKTVVIPPVAILTKQYECDHFHCMFVLYRASNLALQTVVSSPDLIRRVYHLCDTESDPALGLVLGLGPRLCKQRTVQFTPRLYRWLYFQLLYSCFNFSFMGFAMWLISKLSCDLSFHQLIVSDWVSLVPNPHASWREMVWWTKSNFLGSMRLVTLLQKFV